MKLNTNLRSTIIVVALILAFGCKTEKNGYSRMAVRRYDIQEIRTSYLKRLSNIDTAIVIQLYCSGCIQGTENDLFIFKKKNKETQIERTSNFRKFNTYAVSDTAIKWIDITSNIQLYLNDTINNGEYIKDGKKYFRSVDHGMTQGLDIYFGNIKHSVFLGPSVEYYNKSNINLSLINNLTSLVNEINWIPAEKIKSRMMR